MSTWQLIWVVLTARQASSQQAWFIGQLGATALPDRASSSCRREAFAGQLCFDAVVLRTCGTVVFPAPHPLHVTQAGLAWLVEVTSGAMLICYDGRRLQPAVSNDQQRRYFIFEECDTLSMWYSIVISFPAVLTWYV